MIYLYVDMDNHGKLRKAIRKAKEGQVRLRMATEGYGGLG